MNDAKTNPPATIKTILLGGDHKILSSFLKLFSKHYELTINDAAMRTKKSSEQTLICYKLSITLEVD